MIHMQLRVPSHLSEEVVSLLSEDDGVTNVAVFEGAYCKPDGCLVIADVAREGAHGITTRLHGLGLHHDGSIMLTEPATLLSDAAEAAEKAAPGHPDDGLVWDVVEDRVRKESRMSFAYLAFLTLAVLIAGTGRLLDQPILIIGAMVVGPEFSPIAAICVALARPRLSILPMALRTLVLGYLIAVAAAVPFWVLVHVTGNSTIRDASSGRLTEFIVHPDGWSLVIALLAGVAGVLSLTSDKSGPLVGVFISVTTVPAAGTIALCLGTGVWHEVWPAFLQLNINIAGMVVAGALTLLAQRVYWSHKGGRGPRLHGW
ncbi:DUF389 domain-containing protein [Nocardioides sp. HDW12B]|uniref:DUF389 domain-containing protein n=1 Tax=Nocardioides sp. HDW12B TaxID=2714939 RepID=UPI00140E278C|nr:DUF389 domain-containing protein [Nocardioides sp. HDW12B]QIK65422.1 DUF389 domain-containing protein [Nocardioides sp. HDW12B]